MYAPLLTGIVIGMIIGGLAVAFVLCALIRAKQIEVEIGDDF